MSLARADESCQWLITVPGIGPIISSAMVAAIGNGAASIAVFPLGTAITAPPPPHSKSRGNPWRGCERG